MSRSRILIAVGLLTFIEMGTAVLPQVASPTATVASLLVTTTPGPLATWFLDTFRSAARPLTVMIAGALMLGLIALILPLGRRKMEGEQYAGVHVEPDDTGPVISRRALMSGIGLGGAMLVGLAVLLRPGATGLHVELAGRLRASRGLPPLTPGQDVADKVPGLSPILTPVDRFFRIDTAITIPRVERRTWRLRVHGMVERELAIGFDDLLSLGLEEHDATICCVSNDVGGDLVGTARWTGVPLRRVLELAGPRPDADQLVGRSVDGWTAGFPTSLASAPDALIAIGMNGIELPPRHGHPARLVVPGLYGYVSATKWLSELELTRWDAYDAYWIRRGWSKSGPVKTMTRIDVPGRVVAPGTVRAAGVAWAPDRGVSAVELRIDRGPWRRAICSEPLGDSSWRQWWIDVDLEEGDHVLQARAIDGGGAVQPEGPRDVLPDGAEGWHWVPVRARP